MRLHTEAFTQRKFTHRSFYAQNLVRTCLHKALTSTTSYCKVPVLICTTKLAQSTYDILCTTMFSQRTPQYNLAPLQRVRPSTFSHHKACTNYFPALLCTAKLAQTTSQYYFVLQSLREALPGTTLYYKACTNYFLVLLCTTKLADRTSQYYLNYFLVLLCTTKLAQSTSQYYFVLQSLHKLLPSTTLYHQACT